MTMCAARLAILRELAARDAERRPPPTWRELDAAIGARSSHRHIPILEGDGLIRRERGISRGLFLTEAGREMVARRWAVGALQGAAGDKVEVRDVG